MDMLETILQYLENGYRNMRKIYRFEDILPEHQFDDTASVLVQSLNTAGFQKQFSSKEAVKYYCLGKWREFKTAYSIHSEFLKALSNTEDATLKTEVFRRLPVPSFYLECSREPVCGYIVVTEPHNDGDCLIAITEVNGIDFEKQSLLTRECSLWFQDGETVLDALQRLINKTDHTSPDIAGTVLENMTTADDPLLKRLYQRLNVVISIAYYLGSLNPDIRKIKTPKEKRPKDASGKRLNYRRWEVGYREGASIEKMLQQSEPAEPTGKSHKVLYKMRPHVRRAHWHHYWTGRGRQKLVVKWIAPILVNNTDESGGIIPTVHRSEFCKGD